MYKLKLCNKTWLVMQIAQGTICFALAALFLFGGKTYMASKSSVPKFKEGQCVLTTYKSEFRTHQYHEKVLRVGQKLYLTSMYDSHDKQYLLDGVTVLESTIDDVNDHGQIEKCL